MEIVSVGPIFDKEKYYIHITVYLFKQRNKNISAKQKNYENLSKFENIVIFYDKNISLQYLFVVLLK